MIWRAIVAVIAGLLSVIATEGGVFFWLNAMPAHLDVTGSIYLAAVLPVVLAISLLIMLLLGWLFKAKPGRLWLIYLLAWCAGEVIVLTMLANSTTVIARYLAVIVAGGGAVLLTVHWLIWGRRAGA